MVVQCTRSSASSSSRPIHSVGLPHHLEVLAFWKAFYTKNDVSILIASRDDVSIAPVRHAWQRVMGDNTEPANTNGREVDKQGPQVVLIVQKTLGFKGVTAADVLGMVQTEQQKPTVEDIMEEADEKNREEESGAGGVEDKRKCRAGKDVSGPIEGGRGRSGRTFLLVVILRRTWPLSLSTAKVLCLLHTVPYLETLLAHNKRLLSHNILGAHNTKKC